MIKYTVIVLCLFIIGCKNKNSILINNNIIYFKPYSYRLSTLDIEKIRGLIHNTTYNSQGKILIVTYQNYFKEGNLSLALSHTRLNEIKSLLIMFGANKNKINIKIKQLDIIVSNKITVEIILKEKL